MKRNILVHQDTHEELQMKLLKNEFGERIVSNASDKCKVHLYIINNISDSPLFIENFAAIIDDLNEKGVLTVVYVNKRNLKAADIGKAKMLMKSVDRAGGIDLIDTSINRLIFLLNIIAADANN